MEKLSQADIEKRLEKLQGWRYNNGAIEKSFRFTDFKEAFAVMTRIAFECEAQGHHPEWSNVYNSLSVRLNTHDAGGITTYDFDLAHTIEKIVG
ncbi:4a-hydroxytetrahydrobiopterin dehydratase [Flavobacteriaceae bacterium 3-367]|uniref:4a-hydroxytetrahydrobiopterin dehydratase n=1 Tax=Eudoraea algarum TaxID=3417568 RepID=UPI0032858AAE